MSGSVVHRTMLGQTALTLSNRVQWGPVLCSTAPYDVRRCSLSLTRSRYRATTRPRAKAGPPDCIFRPTPPLISAKSAPLFRNNPPPISAISPPLFRSHPPQLWVEGRGCGALIPALITADLRQELKTGCFPLAVDQSLRIDCSDAIAPPSVRTSARGG